jgi:methyltransferase (TIGR00027 family)
VKAAQASSTAKVIAASTIALASDSRTAASVAPGAAALCKAFLSGKRSDRWLARSAEKPLTRWLWRMLERLTLPGIMAHYWHRKRWIERRCRRAIGQGFERVIVLGAGFDTLGFRLAREHSAIEVIEIDHPATQAAKRHALAGHAEAAPRNLRFMALDLSAEPLGAHLPRDARATVFIIEGVLMYLQAPAIDAMFRTLAEWPVERMRIVFSFMTRWPDGGSGFRPRSGWIERWLAWRGEPFMWAIEPEAMRAWLEAYGLTLLEMVTTRQLTEAVAASGTPLEGENVAVCETISAPRSAPEAR